jgi:hypothetical protein
MDNSDKKRMSGIVPYCDNGTIVKSFKGGYSYQIRNVHVRVLSRFFCMSLVCVFLRNGTQKIFFFVM